MLRDASQRPESVEASVLARAAMLLSMRANQPVAVGEDRQPRSIVSGLLFTMNSATPTCRAQARPVADGKQPLELADQRACASGSGCRAAGASAESGMTSAANSPLDFCASPPSST